jgi:hypothetical protein
LVLATIFYCLRFETSLFVAFYDSQGRGGNIRPRLHTDMNRFLANHAECFCLFLSTETFVELVSRNPSPRKRVLISQQRSSFQESIMSIFRIPGNVFHNQLVTKNRSLGKRVLSTRFLEMGLHVTVYLYFVRDYI